MLFIFVKVLFQVAVLLFLNTVHGFERVSYITPEAVALPGINFRPDVKGNGTFGGTLSGIVRTFEDTAG